MKEIMTLQETKTEYIAKVKGETTIINKTTFEMVNGIKQHPRILAIESRDQSRDNRMVFI